MHSYNIMDVAIVLELALLIFGLWAILNPEGYDKLHRRMRRWERRTWHRITHMIRVALRPLVNRGESTWQA